MPTLYELLEALPEDDADGLRRAFRKAAKANHPDNNPGDPDAAQRFRRLARAHAILQDEAQRATYDASLAKARRQRALNSKRTIFSEFRGLLPHVISSMVIALVSIATFLLFQNFSRMRIASTQIEEISAGASSLAAAMPAQPSDTIGRTGETGGHNKLDDIPVSNQPEASDAVREPAVPAVVATAGDPAAVPATSDVGVKDARYYRERGGLAYRGGDLSLALVDFDLAINLDPNFADAYIDRAIVFRRMGDLKRAFADVAEAKRIDDQKPQQAAPLSGNN